MIFAVTSQRPSMGEKATPLHECIYIGCEIYRKFNSQGDITLERESVSVMDDETGVAFVEARTIGEKYGPQQLTRYQFGNCIGCVALELDEKAGVLTYEDTVWQHILPRY